MNDKGFVALIDRYLKGTASENERKLVEETVKRMSEEKDHVSLSVEEEAALKNLLYSRTIQKISARSLPEEALSKPAARIKRSSAWYMAAASVILALIVFSVWRLNADHALPGGVVNNADKIVNDVPPGKTGAILTLADGSTIILDSAGNGLVASQKGANILKGPDGLVYKSGNGSTEPVYNTVSTPVGRQYTIVLSDGSKVWLNAASSITYPTAFSGRERKVLVSGEVYFEVSKNKTMPFIVGVSSGEEIHVLGTHFNINSYENEPAMHATLLEGSVQLFKDGANVMILPGQQASCERHNSKILVSNVDTDEVMAWKEGFFQFNQADLQYLMRQLSRWYDLTIVFEGLPAGRKLGGRINRNLHLSAVLKVLEAKDIHYRLEGKKLIIKS